MRAARLALGVRATFKTVDTCGAEFEAHTPYHYSTYEDEDEVRQGEQAEGRDPRVGPEPHRSGHRVRLLLRARQLRPARRRLRDRHDQLQPRDGVDRLRHERPPLLRAAHRRGRAERPRGRAGRGERDRRRDRVARRADAAQAGLGVCRPASSPAPSPESIDLAEDRERWNALCARLEIPQPAGGTATTVEQALAHRRAHRLPGAGAPVLRARRPGHGDRLRRGRPAQGHGRAGPLRLPRSRGRPVGGAPVLVDRFLEDAIEVDVDAIRDAHRRGRHRRRHGARRGGGRALR